MNRGAVALGTAGLLGVLVAAAPTPSLEADSRASADAVEASALAENDRACLQSSRLWGARVLDGRTMLVDDFHNRPFLVRLSAACIALSDIDIMTGLATSSAMGCLNPGDEIVLRDRRAPTQRCFVTDVRLAHGPYALDYLPHSRRVP